MTANSHVYTWLRCSDVLPLRGEQQATRSLNLPECALVKRVNGQAEVDASQWSEEKEQVGRACRELEHALAANLTKSSLRKASDAISTIAKMLSGTEASSNKK